MDNLVDLKLEIGQVSYLIQYLCVKLHCYESLNALTPSMIVDKEYLESLIDKLNSSLKEL